MLGTWENTRSFTQEPGDVCTSSRIPLNNDPRCPFLYGSYLVGRGCGIGSGLERKLEDCLRAWVICTSLLYICLEGVKSSFAL